MAASFAGLALSIASRLEPSARTSLTKGHSVPWPLPSQTRRAPLPFTHGVDADAEQKKTNHQKSSHG